MVVKARVVGTTTVGRYTYKDSKDEVAHDARVPCCPHAGQSKEKQQLSKSINLPSR